MTRLAHAVRNAALWLVTTCPLRLASLVDQDLRRYLLEAIDRREADVMAKAKGRDTALLRAGSARI